MDTCNLIPVAGQVQTTHPRTDSVRATVAAPAHRRAARGPLEYVATGPALATAADPMLPARVALIFAQANPVPLRVLRQARDMFEAAPPAPGTPPFDCLDLIQALALVDAWQRRAKKRARDARYRATKARGTSRPARPTTRYTEARRGLL